MMNKLSANIGYLGKCTLCGCDMSAIVYTDPYEDTIEIGGMKCTSCGYRCSAVEALYDQCDNIEEMD